MTQVTEVTVILKADERKYTQKFLSYEDYTVNQDDPVIMQFIEEAKKSFEGKPEQVKIRVNMEVV